MTQIQIKVSELLSKGFLLGASKGNEVSANYGGFIHQFQNANIYWHSVMGDKAHEVHGGILTKYLSLGGHDVSLQTGQRIFGFPLTDEERSGDDRVPVSTFEWGKIYFIYNAAYVHGEIYKYYKSLNENQSWLGYPVSDPVVSGGMEIQHFEFGSLLLDIAHNAIYQAKWITPQLGKPWLLSMSEVGLKPVIEITVAPHFNTIVPVLSQSLAQKFLDALAGKIFLKVTGVANEVSLNFSPLTLAGTSPRRYTANFSLLPIIAVQQLKNNTLYDIIIKMPGVGNYTLAAHSLYIKNDWTNPVIAHITDVHIARRNDTFRKKLQDLGFTNAVKAYNNPNDRLREFILLQINYMLRVSWI